MTRLLAGLLVLGVVTLAGSRFVQARWNVPLWFRRLFDTGLIFIIVGVGLGPAGVRLLDEHTLDQTGPIVVTCLGWIGFLFGAHLEFRRLRRVTRAMWFVILGEALLTFALVLVAAWIYFSLVLKSPGSFDQRWAALITLAVCAAGTAPASVFLLADRPLFRGEVAQGLKLIASLDDLPGLLIFGTMFALLPTRAVPGFGVIFQLGWVALNVLLGVLLGYLLKSLTVAARDEQTRLLVLLGTIALGSGLAASIHLSPIFIGAVAGVTFANTAGKKEPIFGLLAASEHPIYVLFMLLVGCMWAIDSEHIVGLAALYLGARTIGKILGAYLGVRAMSLPSLRLRLGGLGLLGQGGMAIALAVNYERVYPSSFASLVVTALILGVMLNELLGPFLAGIPFGRPRPREGRR